MKLTIGQMANEAGVNIETIRYYERRGLIQRPVKPANGFRRYGGEVLDRLRFIRKAKSLGFQLDEIESLLRLSEKHCADVQTIAQQKLDQVRAKIQDLVRLEATLGDLVQSCKQRRNPGHCPIIEKLLDGSETAYSA